MDVAHFCIGFVIASLAAVELLQRALPKWASTSRNSDGPGLSLG